MSKTKSYISHTESVIRALTERKRQKDDDFYNMLEINTLINKISTRSTFAITSSA